MKEKIDSRLAELLRHLITHSAGYPTQAERAGHLAAVDQLAGDGDEAGEAGAPARKAGL